MITNRIVTKPPVTLISQSMRWPSAETSRGRPIPVSGSGPAKVAMAVSSAPAPAATLNPIRTSLFEIIPRSPLGRARRRPTVLGDGVPSRVTLRPAVPLFGPHEADHAGHDGEGEE